MRPSGLADARAGSTPAVAELVDQYRPYPPAVANQELDSDLRPKIGPSDLVQELLKSAKVEHRVRNWEQMAFAEIGKQMNRSPEAARKLWSRAVVRLQQELSADGGQVRPEPY